MSEMLKLVGSLSLAASILTGVVWLMKPWMQHRISKRIQYVLWIVLMLRLLLPVTVDNSLMNHIFHYGGDATVIQSQQTVNGAEVSSLPTVQQKVTMGVYRNDVDHSRFLNDLWHQTLVSIWLGGALLAGFIYLVGYVRFCWILKQSHEPAEEEVYQILKEIMPSWRRVKLVRNSRVSTPLLVGWIKPCVVLPSDLIETSQLRYVLMHEMTHLRHFDIVIKWMTLLATCLHWFNPVVYFMKTELNKACELACDEAVIERLSATEKQSYGEMLIALASEKQLPRGVLRATLVEEKNGLKERLLAIMKHRSTKWMKLKSIGVLTLALAATIWVGAYDGTINKSEALSTAGWNLQSVSAVLKHKTPYVGNNSKVSSLIQLLPQLDERLNQKFMSLKTASKPYGLTVFYEAQTDVTVGKIDHHRAEANALMLFCAIDNLDEVTFAVRATPSTQGLERSAYVQTVGFKRSDIEKKYGAIDELIKNPKKLTATLSATN